MRRMRVLVCGTNYGRAYLTALSRQPGRYELAGILARGSKRSREVAGQCGAALYRDVKEIPAGIDLACAAMNARAFPVVLELLRRQIHVLCEHPQPHSGVKKALRVARQRNLKFHLNGHFAQLAPARAFAKECRRRSLKTAPVFVQCMGTERSLYGLLEVLRAGLGGFGVWRLRAAKREPGLCALAGRMGGVPIEFVVQVSAGPGRASLEDGSAGYLWDHRIAVSFPQGTLTLMAISGPVVWNSVVGRTAATGEPLWKVIHPGVETRRELQEQRVQANRAELDAMRRAILYGHAPPHQSAEHVLEVSRAWERMGRLLYAARGSSGRRA